MQALQIQWNLFITAIYGPNACGCYQTAVQVCKRIESHHLHACNVQSHSSSPMGLELCGCTCKNVVPVQWSGHYTEILLQFSFHCMWQDGARINANLHGFYLKLNLIATTSGLCY